MPNFLKFLPIDKCLHFLAGGFVAGIVYALTTSHWWAVGVTAVVGITKEIYDYFHPEDHTAEVLDAIATLAGAVPLLLVVCIHHSI